MSNIILENVSKFYGEILGVNKVNLTIPPGITSLVGPNGSGKTTLMNLLAGLLQPTRGRIEVCGLSTRDPERYFFSVFGTPSTHSSWGWRVEGHHVSLHFTVVDGSLVAGAPSFFGANPAEVRAGPKQGTRVLGPEEDVARALVESLDASQRELAIINANAPNDIVTMANVKIIHPETGGIAEVPRESLPHHYASGWRPLAEDEEPQPETTAGPEPMTKAQAAKAARSSKAATTSAESEE